VTPLAKPFRELTSTEMGYRVFLRVMAGPAAQLRAKQGDRPGFFHLRTREESTSFHEAGHAVAAIVLMDYRIDSLSIVPEILDGRVISNGHCTSRPHHTVRPPKEEIVETSTDGETATAVAGLMLFTSSAVPSQWEIDAYCRSLEPHAALFVEAHWAAITAVAHELLVLKTMVHEQVEKILGSTGLLSTVPWTPPTWTPPILCETSLAIQ
jgi:hypothetical protein